MATLTCLRWCCALLLLQRAIAAPGTVCKYKTMKGHAYESAETWKEADTHEKAKKMCDEDDECAGYHLHGMIDNGYYLYKHTNGIVNSKEAGDFVKDFVLYKKRMMTCSNT